VVIFPQATRSAEFDPAEFNSLGVKLAARAGVPVIPLALRTDFMGNGRLVKDLGPIDPGKGVYYAFGAPLQVSKTGRETHEAVVKFITTHLKAWGGTVKESGGT
jgi:1-acyl-sn-glycerol-3-phosphate acyltransferase